MIMSRDKPVQHKCYTKSSGRNKGADLAKFVGISRNTISSIETLQFIQTAKLALLLCIALDIKFEDLFYF